MTFLPVAERELLVASRKPMTYRLRVMSALLGLLIGGGLLAIHSIGRFGAGQIGSTLFSTLTWLAFLACIAAGVFLTSDCISEEKREGTLGFLLLTDLRGWDIVAGKLAASSLRSIFGLIAILPMLGLTLLMGGVGGGQFWQTCAALLVTLGCSLATGLFASTITRQSQAGISGTVFLLLAIFALGPILDQCIRNLVAQPGFALFSFTSPAYLFLSATKWGGRHFGMALAANSLAVLFLLSVSGILVRRLWNRSPRVQERARPRSSSELARAEQRRRRLLDPNPIVWLASRERALEVGAWLICTVTLVAFGVLMAVEIPAIGWAGWGVGGGLMIVLLYIWTAAHASRLMFECRRCGLLDLLLSTPLSVEQIVQGQWRALVRSMALPVILFLAVHTVATVLSFRFSWSAMAAAQPSAPQVGNVSFAVVGALLSSVGVLANLVALCWFGMWSGLTSRSNNHAALKTLAFVQVLPWFVISFLSGIGTMALLVPRLLSGGTVNPALNLAAFQLLAIGVPTSLGITKDLIFVFWAKGRLASRLRGLASNVDSWRKMAPPTPGALPPVIKACG